MYTSTRFLRFVILALLTTLVGSSAARAQCVDWTPGYHLAGIDGTVHALAVFDDGTGNGRELYAGGQFIAAGDAVVSNIAKWNGTRWAAVGVGRPTPVRALLVWDDGTGPALYAGIGFTQGYVPPNGTLTTVARWNGVAWNGLPGGVDFGAGNVLAMTVHDDGTGSALYVGGGFHSNSPNPPVWPQAPSIARFDGTTWSPVGNGFVSTSYGVRALASFDNGTGPALYAGGSYLRVAPGTVYGPIARFDGTQWALAHDGLSAPYSEVLTFALYGGTLHAAGKSLLGQNTHRVVALNGTTWSPLPGTVYGDVSALLTVPSSPNDLLLAAGIILSVDGVETRGIASWDGSSWSPVGATTDYSMGPLALYDDGTGQKLFAGGDVSLPNAPDARGIASYDANGWSALGSGIDPYFNLGNTMVSFDDGQGPALYANSATGVVRRVGDSWVPVGSLNRNVGAMTVHDDGVNGPALYAALSATVVNGQNLAQVARWDGTTWTILGQGIRFVNTGWTPVIHDLASFDDGNVKRLVVGGDFDYTDGQSTPFAVAWDGQAWTPLGPELNHIVYDLQAYDDGSGAKLFAGGLFAVAGAQPGIARWDNGHWVDAGAGAPRTFAMHVHDFGSGPRLLAARSWAGTSATSGISMFDGTTWSSLTTGTTPSEFESYDDGAGTGPALFVTGPFMTIGGVAARGIARYDGVQWSALGAGFSSDSYGGDMQVHDDGQGAALFVFGPFTTAGDYPSYRFARYGPTGAPGCVLTTGSTICAGDGGGSACPCGNTGAPDRGCGNSANASGAVLVAEGQAHRSYDNVTLRASGMTPGGAALFFQGTLTVAAGAGAPFGDGVRCVSGAQVRLAIRPVSGGVAAFGEGIPGDASVSSAGHLPVGASTRIYQAWYRDAQSFCTPSTFNLSNGLRILWAP